MLDNVIEIDVMNAIREFEGDMTILIVVRRLSTVKHCNNIVELSKGHIKAHGSFDEQIKFSASFRKLALASDHQDEA